MKRSSVTFDHRNVKYGDDRYKKPKNDNYDPKHVREPTATGSSSTSTSLSSQLHHEQHVIPVPIPLWCTTQANPPESSLIATPQPKTQSSQALVHVPAPAIFKIPTPSAITAGPYVVTSPSWSPTDEFVSKYANTTTTSTLTQIPHVPYTPSSPAAPVTNVRSAASICTKPSCGGNLRRKSGLLRCRRCQQWSTQSSDSQVACRSNVTSSSEVCFCCRDSMKCVIVSFVFLSVECRL